MDAGVGWKRKQTRAYEREVLDLPLPLVVLAPESTRCKVGVVESGLKGEGTELLCLRIEFVAQGVGNLLSHRRFSWCLALEVNHTLDN